LAIKKGMPMAKQKQFVTDEQWAKIEPLLPEYKPSPKGGRRPKDNRDVFEGIAWVLRSGARWQDLPDKYPSSTTCWRRLQEWEEQGIWLRIWRKFLSELDERGQLEWEETFADGSFASAKKGGLASARPNAEKVRSGWWWSMARESLSVLISIRPRRMR
jgi:transposase